jgi:hypothetical protein
MQVLQRMERELGIVVVEFAAGSRTRPRWAYVGKTGVVDTRALPVNQGVNHPLSITWPGMLESLRNP